MKFDQVSKILTPQGKKIHPPKLQDEEITFLHSFSLFLCGENQKGMVTTDDDKVRKYRAVLASFMSWKDNVTYVATHRFEDDQLLAITPEEVEKWFCLKVYGVEEPGPKDKPT